MELTLRMIEANAPCTSGWRTLLKSLNKTKADEEELDLRYILNSNGIEDAIWCLRCFNYEDYCLFLADIAESVLHIYGSKNKNIAPRDAITAIREYKLGNITLSELSDASDDAAAYAAAYNAASATAYHAASTANAAAAATTYTRSAKWEEITALFLKHF